MPYIPQKELRRIMVDLANVRKYAKMEKASFAKPGEMFGNDEYSDEIRESTRIYRESWIGEPIEGILKDLNRYLEKG